MDPESLYLMQLSVTLFAKKTTEKGLRYFNVLHYNAVYKSSLQKYAFSLDEPRCRFLQGPETDPTTVRKIRDAIDNQTDVTVQLINYTKTGIFGLQ